MATKVGILERLKAGPVVGDGSYVFTLEKRGYVHVPSWTPEVVVEHPDAVRELHKEYLRAGADVLQAFSFFATGDKLKTASGQHHSCEEINSAACKLALEVANTGDALVCGGISPTETYKSKTATKEEVQAEFQQQVDAFKNHKIDFLLGEFFFEVREAEWGIEVLKKSNLPVGVTMAVGQNGDTAGVSAGECAVRMARAGADIVGVNCHYDYKITLGTIKLMKEALDAAGLRPYLMTQPLGFHVPEVKNLPFGYMHLPEYPFALEPRLMTRWDARTYAREAYDAGVRYIGGCCGFEPHHIREIAEELAPERGKRPPGADKSTIYGSGYNKSNYPFLKIRNNKDYWMNIKPSFGRPDNPVLGNTVDIPLDRTLEL